MSKSIALGWVGAGAVLLAILLLMAVSSVFTLHVPVAAQGISPTATTTPALTSAPIPAPVSTAPPDATDDGSQPDGLFYEVDGEPPPSIGVDTLASRLVGIDLGQLAQVIESPFSPKDPVTGKPTKPQTLALNLFDEVVLTGIVEHVEPTASGHALWGGLEGVELGTMTLVVNGSVVVGTVRTPDAVYTIRTAAAGAYVVRQIDESSLPPLGEPLRGSLPEPDSPPPVRPQVRGPDAPDGTSTPTSTPTPVPNMPTSPSKPAPDEAMASGLFSEVEGDPPPSPGVDTLASRLVEIDFGQLSQVTKSPVGPKDPVTGKPTEPQALVLNLFDDVVLTGIVEHVEPTSSGHSLWGRLDGVGLGTFTLVVSGRMVIGTVRTPDAVFTIRTGGDGTYVIRQIDESSLPPLGEPLEGPSSTPEARSESDDVPPDDGSMIDVMVVYTPLAKHQQGGRAAIEALIDLFVAETNQVNAISGVTHRIRLVLRDEVDYIEDGNSFIDLRRLLEDSDGFMDHVHELRDLYAADLVHIVVSTSVNVCGVAANIGSPGFALTVSYCGGLVFAHELGHNMGLAHDRYAVGVPAEGSHYGYVNQRMFEAGAPESARWRTIMAYEDQCEEVAEYYCERIGYFSNPEVTYNGDPMGVPADHPSTGVDGPADAVKTLNDRREITANFRRSSSSPTPRVGLTMSPYWLAEDGGVSTVTATLHRPSSADTTVTILASPSDAVTLSGSRTLTIPAGRTVSVASVTITGVDNGDQAGDVSVTVSATATNTSSLSVVDPEPVALVIADDETTPVVTLSLSPSEIAEHQGWTFVTAKLDSRSSADTTVSVSAEPAELIEQREENTLTIPAGQTESIGFGVRFWAVDNAELAEATQTVTVSGTSENAQGVADPENVTLTIIDDEAPFFADDSIAYTFTTGIAGSRFLPEAEFGNGKLTYSLSPAPSNDVIFTPGPPARIGVSATSVAAGETSYTLTATDADGDTDTMTISITVRKGVCPNSAAVSGYSDPGIVHDCEALLASRDILSVDQSLNWDEDLPIDEWKGIRIAAGRVVGLRMSSEGIVGTIPSELGSLANLQRLYLSGNQLTGEIPPELGGLSNLTHLSLSGNQLTGEIPPELGGLSNLTWLFLSGNQLTGEIPPELGGLSNLEWLYIPSNQFTGTIPKELGSLANLQGLWLWGNGLTGEIPPELGGLSNLTLLVLSGNQLTGEIPPELGRLSNLTELDLSDNRLTGSIAKELGNLSNLQELYLGGNLLTGCVPDGLRDVPNNDFVKLGLPFCSEHPCVSGGAVVDATNTGLVSDCGMLLAARDTLAGTAALNWSADTPIADWTGVALGEASGRVTEILLGGMGLNGNIPKQLGSLTNLQSLDLSDNRLTGSIAAELLDLANLQELYLGGNLLTGCVPDGLRDVPNNDIARLGLPFCSEHPCVSGGAVVDATNTGLKSDCERLLAARDTLAGTASLNWSADTPITEWNGVVLGETSGRVTEILLGGIGLDGRIPKELGSLANLTHLSLDNNQLTGEIPPELGGLSNLRHLSLWSNQLTGEIPPELGRLSNLTGLFLDGNQLTGEIPPELGGLSNLTELNLHNNGLTGEIPPELGGLSNLTQLWLWSNQLTGEIPPELGGLSNLTELNLDNNGLTGEIPPELGGLSNLTLLRLPGNQLTGEIPPELGGLSNLTQLVLDNNGLTGEIPPELGGLSNLQRLFLSGNELTGEIPPELGGLSNLQQLYLWGNELTGEIPPELGGLSNLTGLWLHVNQLTGEIPPELGGLSNLNHLILADNGLTGEIPPELGRLSNLTGLWLHGNQLTGEIPPELGGLSNLQRLYLDGNLLTGCVPAGLRDVPNNDIARLGLPFCSEHPCVSGGAVVDATNTGLKSDCERLLAARDTLAGTAALNWSADTPITEWNGVVLGETSGRVTEILLGGIGLDGRIPKELGSLANLTHLSLDNNQLTGEIPPELGGLSNLRHLSLWSNQLTGEIPPELGRLSNLTGLFLDGNQLTGEIPPELGGLSNLTELNLHNNGLTGEIPPELGGLSNLTQLWLWSNQLTGEIPPELGGLSNLTELNLDNNGLTGEIPPELGGLSNLTLLRLPGNQLTGEIPPELGGLSNLTELSLADNGLTGEIPPELGGLSNLELLWLWGNQLTGEIPPELGGLSNLTTLWLHRNQLTGEIPPELGGLSNLTDLILADNQLTGEIPPELGGLSNLTGLWLHNNQLTGEIPPELGGLSNLEVLWLWGNQLTGEIPPELGGLSNLTTLSLSGNQLTGEIPPELGGLSNLTRLVLSRNQLTGEIPPELGGLSNLTTLSLWGNQLTGEIPPELGRLSNLTQLYLHGNQLTGEIPPELGGLANLQRLYLSDNQLTGEIPPELGGLSNLTQLYLHGNQLTGEIPPELGGLANLQRLYLSDNQLTGEIPPELGGLANLQRLYLSDNRLTGCVPPRLRDVPDNDLDQLGLPFCPLSPPEASTISSVTSEMDSLTISWATPLSDGGSDITAYDLRHIETDDDETVDPNWTVVEDVWTSGGDALEYTLTGLTADTQYDIQVRAVNAVGDGTWSATVTATTVSASACVAGGAVSDAANTGLVSDCAALLSAHDTLARTGSLNWSADTPMTKWDGITVRGTPARVVWLNIRGGGLEGSVPAELGELSSLTYLNLRNNGLSGPIPTELGNLTKLTYLGLNNNMLTGPIPDLSRMTRLQQLYLSNNDLSGDLPDWMGTLTEVKELWLWGNELEGPIPDLSGMIGLNRLKLQNNQFTGGIPTWFGDMTNLRYLYLHYNPLGGTIPSELGDMSRLRYLWLHNSQLTGSIPAELGRLSKLWDLNLHTNQLDGSIPAELGGMDSLQRLRLHRNMLSGQIPTELGDLENLRFMWLHGNMLEGSIPAELGNLTKLERLWLSENELSGPIPPELGQLSSHKLVQWRLSGEEHQFTGCLPAGLAAIADNDFDSLGLQVCTSTTGRTHVILRVVQVTEDWVPFSDAGGWTRAVIQKESDVLRYYEAAIWEETDSVHLYAFPNDYDGLFGLDEDVPDADVIAYREQYAISVHSDMPEMWGDRRSDFLRIAFEDFVSRLVELHPEADHHLMYSGHGGPGGNLFAGQLKHDDAGAFLATWTRLLGKPLGVIDMGGPCNKGGYEDLANFCRHASYYVASDLPNGGYTLDDWTWEKHHETDPETQYHRLLASNETLEEALIERVELRRKNYEYSMNNQIRDQVEQANYVYSCARFNDFYEAFELFVDVTTIQAPSYDLYQLMLDYTAPPALLDRFRDVFVHGVDNRDFFEWKVTANGMLSPSGG